MPIRTTPQFFARATTQCQGGSIFLHNLRVALVRLPHLPRRARLTRSDRPRPPPNTRADSFGPHHGLHFVGEDDEEELLCSRANSALQDDGTVGIVGEDGEVSLPVTPLAGAFGLVQGEPQTHRRAEAGDDDGPLDARDAEFAWRVPRAYGGYDEEPCLSDSWHATETSDASITALRRQYHTVFGKETSSNNRQWLLRRLAEINSYGGDDASDDAGDFHSGNGEGGSDGEDGSPFTSASAGTHDGRFFSVGDSEKKMGVPRGVVGRGRAAEKAVAPVVRGASARGKTEKKIRWPSGSQGEARTRRLRQRRRWGGEDGRVCGGEEEEGWPSQRLGGSLR